jgi:hypothetical protein
MILELRKECDECGEYATSRTLKADYDGGDVLTVDVDVELQQLDFQCECGEHYVSGDFDVENVNDL